MLNIGDIAPDFDALDQFGNRLTLAQLKGKKNIVLFFYPKDDTPGCTAEVCAFRDNYEQFRDLDTEVIGVNQGGSDKHKGFSDRHSLNFSILHDSGNVIRKAYKVPNKFLLLPGRVTYIIDKQCKIVSALNDMFNAERHIKDALNFLSTS